MLDINHIKLKNEALTNLDFRQLKEIKWQEIVSNVLTMIQEPRGGETIIYTIHNSFGSLVCSWQILTKKSQSSTTYWLIKQTWDCENDQKLFYELVSQSDIEKYEQRVRTKALEDFLRPKIYSFYLSPFQPTISVEKYPLEAQLFHAYWKKMQKINLASYVPLNFGCDGTTYTLSIKHSDLGTTHQWWGNLPKEWKSLQPLIDFMENYSPLVGANHASPIHTSKLDFRTLFDNFINFFRP